jgi:hypothetical protein
MLDRWKRIWIGCLLLSVFVAGCAGSRTSTARLYNLQSGVVITLHLQTFYEGRGALSATMPDGEEVTGEFRISKREHDPPQLVRPATENVPSDADGQDTSRTTPKQPERSWPEVYGYGPDSDAKPVGTAVGVGNRGTVLEIVLYSANLQDGDADGVGRDNKGNWYRVQVGELR